MLPGRTIERTVIDFTELEFCNSNGFYIIMDIIELVYAAATGPVLVRRLEEDDWQQETLPILLNLDEAAVAARTSFEDVARDLAARHEATSILDLHKLLTPVILRVDAASTDQPGRRAQRRDPRRRTGEPQVLAGARTRPRGR
jgi:hypothetical protein